jgi:acyl-CoA reductase-like NAD-dependent aldehyde dehydrogenase
VEAVRRVGIENAEMFARETFAETGMGRVADKIAKHIGCATLTPGFEDLETTAWSGDHGLTIEEMAPFGVIGAVTPSTHPVPTMLNNTISNLVAGNGAVFNGHPGGKRVFAHGLALMNQAIVAAGGPANIVSCVAEPTIESANEMFNHPDIRLLLITGGPGVVKAAMTAPKRVIAAGPGNPPVVVDETADLQKAAISIINGASFDCNVLCTGEKEVFVVDTVADELKRHMVANGCYELTTQQIEQLAAQVFQTKEGSSEPVLNRARVGNEPAALAATIGLQVPATTRMLIGETSKDHHFVQHEQMTSFLPIVRTRDVDQAIDFALEAEHGFGHTSMIHSRNIAAMDKMARLVNTTIFVKNGPSYAGGGSEGEGTLSYSIATPTGEGLTTARTFTRKRRCALVDYFRIV